MARTKGSKNKSTIAREEARMNSTIDIDKHDNIIFAGKKVGKIDYVDGVFVATVGEKRFGDFDLDLALEKARESLV